MRPPFIPSIVSNLSEKPRRSKNTLTRMPRREMAAERVRRIASLRIFAGRSGLSRPRRPCKDGCVNLARKRGDPFQ